MHRFWAQWRRYCVIATCMVLSSCVSSTKSSMLILDTATKVDIKNDSPEVYLSRLDKFLEKNPEQREVIKDVWLMIKAEVEESHGSLETASKLWLESLDSSDSDFGKIALQGWIGVNKKILGAKASPEVLARLLLAQSEKRRSSYLNKEHLLELALLQKRFESEGEGADVQRIKSAHEAFCPLTGSWPKDDPLLLGMVGNLCKLKSDGSIEGTCSEWTASLSTSRRNYFWGMVYKCVGRDQQAVEHLKRAISLLEKDSSDNMLAIEAADGLAVIMRRMGKRAETADVYAKLISLYTAGKNHYEGANLTEIAYFQKRIDRYLWAARSRALIGDYLTAKNIVHEAFGLISKAQIIKNLRGTDREALIGFRAEGYHILASRIAVEQRDFNDAVNINKTALQIPNLSDSWSDRFRWYEGLYTYIGGSKVDAITVWQSLYKETSDLAMKERVGFWLARAHFESGNKEAFEQYSEQLVEHYPFGFYSVVGFAVAGLPENDAWKEKLNNKQQMRDRLAEANDDQLNAMRNNKELGPALLRAEILVQNRLGRWADLAIKNLYKNMSTKYPIKGNGPKFLYVSKMYYMMGAYGKAISLIDAVAAEQDGFWTKYPEMMYIYYPAPYRDIFKQYAFENYLDMGLLLAIAHVESRFAADAKSGAGAKGLMQVVEPTAERYIRALKMDGDERALDLNDPRANIAISASYLKYLKAHYKSKNAYIIGAYNAGESVVDRWLEVRHAEDLMVWLELVPFKETNDYIKHVWVGLSIYHEITGD